MDKVQLRDKLHMSVTGGARGTITAVREQAWCLFTCTVSVAVESSNGTEHRRRLNKMLIAEDIELWWTNKARNQESLWESRLELSQKFFEYLLENPVPIDWNAVRYLSRSSLALDLYFVSFRQACAAERFRKDNLVRPSNASR
jgi:Plasmid encoded RepA protein